MNKRLLLPAATIAFVGLTAAFASTAQAFPTQTSRCTGCHSGAGATISTTLVSTAGTNATYSFSASGADAVAVFDGTTKLFTFTASSGQFTVATGKTYTLYAVTGPTTSDGIGSTTVSPAAAPVDSVAPVTTSDAVATYVSSATIKLTASDAGSGVAATYYILDGGVQMAGTTINSAKVGAHTLEFWSVDVAGNVETHKTAAFTITAPVPVDSAAPVTTSDAVATYVSSATIRLTASDAGSGVAATYYILDGGVQMPGTTIDVTALGAHTLEFWSVDVAGNVEVHHSAAFTITEPAPLPTPDPTVTPDPIPTPDPTVTPDPTPTPDPTVTPTPNPTPTPDPSGGYQVTTRVRGEHSFGRTATLTNLFTGAKYTAIVGRNGSVTFADVPAGIYRLSVGYGHSNRIVRVGLSRHYESDDAPTVTED